MGDVDYGELLRSNGIVIQTIDVDDGSMDDVSDPVSVSMEENLDNDDLQIGMPLYGSATGDVDPEPQAPMGTHGKSQAVSHGHPPQEPSTATGEATEKPSTAMVNESW